MWLFMCRPVLQCGFSTRFDFVQVLPSKVSTVTCSVARFLLEIATSIYKNFKRIFFHFLPDMCVPVYNFIIGFSKLHSDDKMLLGIGSKKNMLWLR